jgi:hypothetical protein
MDRLERRLAKVERDLAMLKWMVACNFAVQLAILASLWELMLRLPR